MWTQILTSAVAGLSIVAIIVFHFYVTGIGFLLLSVASLIAHNQRAEIRARLSAVEEELKSLKENTPK